MNEADKETKEDFQEDPQPWRPEDEGLEADDGIFNQEAAPEDTEKASFENEPGDENHDTLPADGEDTEQDEDNSGSGEHLQVGACQDELACDANVEIQLENVIEAVLFAADEPVIPQKLVEIIGTGTVKDVRKYIDMLNEKYTASNHAFRIEAIAGGYQMLTLPLYNPWLKKLLKVRSETKLSPAALETLAVIAYKQPVMRVDVESIRGVAAGEMIRQLTEKGLVKVVGRAEIIGRPLLYGTTKKFLEIFGLNSIKDLPTTDELKNPTPSETSGA